MTLFDITEAPHFCQPLPAHLPGVGQSLADFHRHRAPLKLREGTPDFQIHQVSLLNAVERWLLFGAAHYRRSLDMFIPSNAPWAQVTLYYSSFFAANAILGMFGAWVHINSWVDVESGIVNQQVLRVNKIPKGIPLGGSHVKFWHYFYDGCNVIAPWVPTEFESAIEPVNNDRSWQIKARNNVNYDMSSAFNAAVILQRNARPRDLRGYGGELGQQLEVTENMLRLAMHFAKAFKINSHAYGTLAQGTLPKVLRPLVTKVPPSLVTDSVLQELFQ